MAFNFGRSEINYTAFTTKKYTLKDIKTTNKSHKRTLWKQKRNLFETKSAAKANHTRLKLYATYNVATANHWGVATYRLENFTQQISKNKKKKEIQKPNKQKNAW